VHLEFLKNQIFSIRKIIMRLKKIYCLCLMAMQPLLSACNSTEQYYPANDVRVIAIEGLAPGQYKVHFSVPIETLFYCPGVKIGKETTDGTREVLCIRTPEREDGVYPDIAVDLHPQKGYAFQATPMQEDATHWFIVSFHAQHPRIKLSPSPLKGDDATIVLSEKLTSPH